MGWLKYTEVSNIKLKFKVIPLLTIYTFPVSLHASPGYHGVNPPLITLKGKNQGAVYSCLNQMTQHFKVKRFCNVVLSEESTLKKDLKEHNRRHGLSLRE